MGENDEGVKDLGSVKIAAQLFKIENRKSGDESQSNPQESKGIRQQRSRIPPCS
jgi:hypothetical protein